MASAAMRSLWNLYTVLIFVAACSRKGSPWNMNALTFLQYLWECFQLPDRGVVLHLEKINKIDCEMAFYSWSQQAGPTSAWHQEDKGKEKLKFVISILFLLLSDIRSEGSIAIIKIFDFDFLMIFHSTSLPEPKNVF